MLKSADKRRLRFVNDQCPLPGSPIPSLHHTAWHGDAHGLADRRLHQPDGFTTVVLRSRFLTWYRSFTVQPPQVPPVAALITVSEWLPRYDSGPRPGWRVFGPPYLSAYARVHADYTRDWDQQARRHLRAFQKSGCSLRLGDKHDVAKVYATSQVPKHIQQPMLRELDKHLRVHGHTIDILVAEKDSQVVGCLVAGNCDEAHMSEYIIGAFHPQYSKDQPMVGIINWWYQRCLEKGYGTLTFGHMEPPRSIWPRPGNGYSLFKTHFGIARIWFPQNRWQIRFNHRALFPGR